MNVSRLCLFCDSSRSYKQGDNGVTECWDCGQQVSDNDESLIQKRTIQLRKIGGKWHYYAINRKCGIVFYIDPPDDFISRSFLRSLRESVFKDFEEITLTGEGTKMIVEELRKEGERFGRHNFRVLSISFSQSLRYNFVVNGIDSHGPADMIFDKKEDKILFLKNFIKFLKEYGIPIVRFAYYAIRIAKELGFQDWLFSRYPEYRDYKSKGHVP
jgi:hypothetical protein